METQHIAGVLRDDLTQPCLRCGILLMDYRGAQMLEGDPEPRAWTLGAAVYVDGYRASTVSLSGGAFRACRP